jgi:uncharacterized OB-fold protein
MMSMEIPHHWRLKAQRYRLEGSSCPVCGRLAFQPRPVCAQCDCAAHPGQISSCGIFVSPAWNRLFDAIILKGMIK